jgi:hypothetical protein
MGIERTSCNSKYNYLKTCKWEFKRNWGMEILFPKIICESTEASKFKSQRNSYVASRLAR